MASIKRMEPRGVAYAVVDIPSILVSGVKRKRGEYISDESKTQDIKHPQASKRRRNDDGAYNAKFMASICFSEHATRRRNAGLSAHSPKDAQLFKNVLLNIFSEIKLGNSAELINKASITLDLLARKEPNSPATKDELLIEFNTTYHTVRSHLSKFDELISWCRTISDILIETLHDLIIELHHHVSTASKWHNILPYTPLPLTGLRFFRDHIQNDHDHPNRPYHHGHLAPEIHDIMHWLTIAPSRIVFSESLKRVAMAAMEQETQRKAGELLSIERPDEYKRILGVVEAEAAERKREQEVREKKRSCGKKEEVARQLTAKEGENKRLEVELGGREKAKREDEARERGRKARAAEDEARRVVGERRERERAQNEQDWQQAVKGQQQQKQQQQTVQEQEAQRHQQDATRTEVAERDQLRKRLQTWQAFLRSIMVAQSDGHQPTVADLQQLEDAPTSEQCLERLHWLWGDLEDPIRNLNPQQLIAAPDRLLELESRLCLAQVSLVALRIYNRNAQDTINTRWKPATLARLQQVLKPFVNQLIGSDLLFIVDQVGSELKEAYRRALKSSMAVTQRLPTTVAFGSSSATQQSPNTSFNSSLTSQTTLGSSYTSDQQGQAASPTTAILAPKNHPQRPYNPLLDPNRTPLDANGLPIPNPRIQPTANPHHNHEDLYSGHYNLKPHHQPQDQSPTPPNFPPRTSTAQLNGADTSTPFHPACRFFKTNTCTNGDTCAFPHLPCAHWLRGVCRYGENCKGSHDVWFLGHMGDVSNVRGDNGSGAGSSNTGATSNAASPSAEATAPPPKAGIQAHASQQISLKACPLLKNNTCTKGTTCTYAHAPCPHFLRGTCRFGESCRRSHDGVFLSGSGSMVVGADELMEIGEGDVGVQGGSGGERNGGQGGQDGGDEKVGRKAWMKNTQCRDGEGCVNRKCGFAHPVAFGGGR